jgi:raffinose/stachyose/melibiose transport system permease protein
MTSRMAAEPPSCTWTTHPTAFASCLMALAPMLIVYVIAQRWVISGVTRGAIK